MHSSLSDRSLFRGMLATALVVAGASACSRSDRTTDDGAQTGAAATTAVDTQPAAAGQDTPAEPRQGVSGYQPMGRDTAAGTAATRATSEGATDTVAVGDSAHVGKHGERLKSSNPSPQASDDSLATQPDSERIRPPEDSSETVGTVTTDSAAVAAAAPMARDTTADLGQVDTAASQDTDTLVQPSDTAVLEARVDTTTQQQDTWEQATSEPQTEVAVGTETDTATVVGDSAEVEKTGERLEPNQTSAEANADTLATETERVRPPEDSTEVLGNVNAEGAEQDVHAEANVEGVGDANAESVGAARVEATGGIATGAAAVSAVTREGQRCTVVDPEQSPEVGRDMASSPATLNPCGTGTMTLPWIWTGDLR